MHSPTIPPHDKRGKDASSRARVESRWRKADALVSEWLTALRATNISRPLLCYKNSFVPLGHLFRSILKRPTIQSKDFIIFDSRHSYSIGFAMPYPRFVTEEELRAAVLANRRRSEQILAGSHPTGEDVNLLDLFETPSPPLYEYYRDSTPGRPSSANSQSPRDQDINTSHPSSRNSSRYTSPEPPRQSSPSVRPPYSHGSGSPQPSSPLPRSGPSTYRSERHGTEVPLGTTAQEIYDQERLRVLIDILKNLPTEPLNSQDRSRAGLPSYRTLVNHPIIGKEVNSAGRLNKDSILRRHVGNTDLLPAEYWDHLTRPMR